MSGWQSFTLADLANDEPNSFVDGPFGSDLKTSDYVRAGVPLIRIQNVKRNHFLSKDIRYISETKARQLARHQYRPGDLIITKLGDPCGVACLVPESAGSGIIVADIVRFRGDKQRVDHRFLSHFINSPVAASWVDREAKGTTRQRVNLSNFRRLPVPLPPLPEQRRIAEILDKADALWAKRRAALAQLDTLTQSIFLDMFGDPATNPNGWPVAALRNLGRVITGGTPPSAKEGMFEGSIPFITPGDLETNQPIKRTVTDAGAAASRTVGAGATLVCCIGATIGKIGKATARSAFNQQINAIEWGERIHCEYGCAVMRFFKPTIVAWGTSTTLPILKKSSFERVEIPVPPVAVQQEFARRIEGLERIRKTHRSALSMSAELFSTLQVLAFRGSL